MTKMISEDYLLTVPFFDVDSMNIVWHGHYSKYLELARCKLLDKIGYNYRDMAASGFSFPIIDMQIKYVKPLVFEQSLVVTASLIEWQYRLKIAYLIRDAGTGEKLTRAHTVQAAVDMQTRQMRLQCPQILMTKVNQLLG